MNNSTSAFIGFIFGGAVGAIATYELLNKKLTEKAKLEIDEVREFYNRRMRRHIEQKESANMPNSGNKLVIRSNDSIDHASFENASDSVDTYGQDSDKFKEAVARFNTNITASDAPYVITPEEFGELDDYERISLTYYEGDDVLVDDRDELVDDIEETVGGNAITHFGEYEDDSVYIRNDARMCDYEILLDHRKYSEVLENKPPSY